MKPTNLWRCSPLFMTSFAALFSINITSPLFGSQSIQEVIFKGQQAMEVLSYQEAIAAYEKALELLEDLPDESELHTNLSEELCFRIADAQYAYGLYAEVVNILIAHHATSERCLSLLALAYKQLSRYDKSLNIFEQLTLKNDVNSELQWQLAHVYYLKDDRDTAKKLFEKFTNDQPRLYLLSQLYLARIDLIENQHQNALDKLDQLTLSVDDPLTFEKHHLMGDAYTQRGDFVKAVISYESSLPPRNKEKTAWYIDTLQKLAGCCLQIADKVELARDERVIYLSKAYEAINNLKTIAATDELLLLRGRYHIIRGRRMADVDALNEAEALLSQAQAFKTTEGSVQALLLRAEAASSYQERDTLYRRLTDMSRMNNDHYAYSWYLRGLNDLEEASQTPANSALYDSSAYALTQAFELAVPVDPLLAARALSKAIHAYANADSDRSIGAALLLLQTLPQKYPQVISSADHPDEFFYLTGWLGSQKPGYFQRTGKPDTTEAVLQRQLEAYPNGHFAPAAHYLLATRYYHKGDYNNAARYYSQVHINFPESQIAGDACYWHARCLEQSKAEAVEYRPLLAKAFITYPQASRAAEAYYSYYTASDYLTGDYAALQHLEKMAERYPNSPYSVNALLLIGLDHKRSRYSEEGKLIRKRNWNKAIDAFQAAETRFDLLYEQGLLPTKNLEVFVASRYRAILERSLTNLAIATESEGPKKHIYLEYAIDMFQRLVNDLQNPTHALATLVARGESYAPLLEEASYGLAVTQVHSGNDGDASATLNQMLTRYDAAKITRGYYRSRAQFQKGMIAIRSNNPKEALDFFAASEESSKGKVLSTDEKLDLWIQRSQCYRLLGQYDNAMLELSRVINEDAISTQRIKAMLLRAEVYELQERPELAVKQLEATAKKGGKWALEAREKLDRDYRYD